ncbi:uncharacterized protein LOC134853069 [Symsagittifera roscoffensis]|uniref:uncharacterized protein LOC134853069 n=1 Tax=Symsagittifera roscoffensis TaxID=84072 RepID=UPI00307C097D
MFKYEEIESVKGLVDVINLYKGSLYHEISNFDMQSKQDLLRNFIRLQLNERRAEHSEEEVRVFDLEEPEFRLKLKSQLSALRRAGYTNLETESDVPIDLRNIGELFAGKLSQEQTSERVISIDNRDSIRKSVMFHVPSLNKISMQCFDEIIKSKTEYKTSVKRNKKMVFLDAICPATVKVEDALLFYQVNKDDFEGQSSGKKRKLNGICDSDCGVHLDKKFSVPPRMIEDFDWLAEEVKSECGWEAPKKSRDSKGKVLHNGDVNTSNESSLPPPSHYLLSPSQMTELGYPDENELMSACGYMRIPSVSKVNLTSDSPLLAIDCEMCLVRNRYTLQSESALTRVAVVDEKYNTLYDTLVKPKVSVD